MPSPVMALVNLQSGLIFIKDESFSGSMRSIFVNTVLSEYGLSHAEVESTKSKINFALFVYMSLNNRNLGDPPTSQ